MRIGVKIDGGPATARRLKQVTDRVRLALGSHVGDVRSLAVRLDEVGPAVRCTIRVRLRGGRALELEAEAATFDEALRFAASRAAATVARRSDMERILGS